MTVPEALLLSQHIIACYINATAQHCLRKILSDLTCGKLTHSALNADSEREAYLSLRC